MSLPAFGSVKRIGVIGAGTIGASWSAYFLSRGYEVSAQDPNPKGEEFLKGFIERAWPSLAKLGLSPGASPGTRPGSHELAGPTVSVGDFSAYDERSWSEASPCNSMALHGECG